MSECVPIEISSWRVRVYACSGWQYIIETKSECATV